MWQERWQLPRASAVYPNVSCGMKSLPKVGHAPVQHLRSGVCTVWDAESNGGDERRGWFAHRGRGVVQPQARIFLRHRCDGVCHGNDMDHTLGLSLPMSAACPPRDPRFATTLAHGLALLEAFDAAHAALTNKELAERSGLSKATVSRLSLTLQAHGLLECGPGERRHRLASAALTLGYPLLAGLGIRREARWGMKQLADELGGSVSLGLRERSRMIYVETSRSSKRIKALGRPPMY